MRTLDSGPKRPIFGRRGAASASPSALSIAIVSSVVMINSVAWGIPLLIGEPGARQGAPSGTQTEAKVQVALAPQRAADARVPDRRGLAARERPDLDAKRSVPLPERAPVPAMALPVVAARTTEAQNGTGSQAGSQIGDGMTERATAPTSGLPLATKPPTLYPRPEQATALRTTRPAAEATPAGEAEGLAADDAATGQKRKTARDVVFVSPYTPGVRVKPAEQALPWRPPEPDADGPPSTIDTAREIARLAAERFQHMRERIAKFSPSNTAAAKRADANHGALMPVASRPPRIVDDGVGRMVAKSAQSYVRPRLVRRPIGGVQAEPVAASRTSRDTASLAPRQSSAGDDGREPDAEPASTPRPTPPLAGLIGRLQGPLERAHTRETPAAAPDGLSALSPPRRAHRQHRVSAAHRVRVRAVQRYNRGRPARQRYTARRRGKIDGFKRSFHRQLVAANFFMPRN